MSYYRVCPRLYSAVSPHRPIVIYIYIRHQVVSPQIPLQCTTYWALCSKGTFISQFSGRDRTCDCNQHLVVLFYRLLLGFIAVTGFLSMWLSNTATTAMMIPIAHAVLIEMWKQKKKDNANSKRHIILYEFCTQFSSDG